MASSKFTTQTWRPKSNLHSTCKSKSKHSRYDFDKDGFVKKEDVRLVLSHIPIEKTIIGNVQGEGRFTSEGGGK
jgi:hypothetical protein